MWTTRVRQFGAEILSCFRVSLFVCLFHTEARWRLDTPRAQANKYTWPVLTFCTIATSAHYLLCAFLVRRFVHLLWWPVSLSISTGVSGVTVVYTSKNKLCVGETNITFLTAPGWLKTLRTRSWKNTQSFLSNIWDCVLANFVTLS